MGFRADYSSSCFFVSLMGFLLCVTNSAYGQVATVEADNLPHFDLEMTSEEYRVLLDERVTIESDDPLESIVAAGKRNLDWIAFINAQRPIDQRLELSNPANQSGIPITNPGLASRQLILAQWDSLQQELPEAVRLILRGASSFTPNPPLPDDAFIILARKVDRTYQRASRWLLQEPYLDRYAERAASDVRGYYFLKHTADLQNILINWGQLAAIDREKYQSWLIGQCRNSDATTAECTEGFATAVSTSDIYSFYVLYKGAAEEHWNSFFQIPVKRHDVNWTPENPQIMSVPFQTPERPEVLAWLRDNIEDEWKWQDWRLRLDFQSSTDPGMTRIQFIPGATPHVDRLAGNVITMDANRDIQEYSSRWTIRHEYGHVLGFPDCYLEFYDEPAGVMVNYQLDVDNLMCSRRGHLQQTHFDALQSAYY